MLGIILVIQLFLCVVAAIGYVTTRRRNERDNDDENYIDWPDTGVALDGFLIFLTYFVLLNTMIPISLVVSM